MKDYLKGYRPLALLGALLLVFGLAVLFSVGPTRAPASQTTSTPAETGLPMFQAQETPWLVVPGLAADASTLEEGAALYRLVCRDCHGDRGQGLTADWIAQWPESSQNCWQSRCHASNHPPEGFILPRTIPALLDPGALSDFDTAVDLYRYIRTKMPWYDPGSLTDDQYWKVTAYLVYEYTGAFIGPAGDFDLAAMIELDTPSGDLQIETPPPY